MLRRLPPLVGVIGINAVPAVGFFAGDWPAAQTMLLYLLENFSLVVFAALRARRNPALLRSFLLVAMAFNGGSAVFVAFFTFGILKAPIAADELLQAFAMIAAVQLALFVYDAIFGPAVDVEKYCEQTLGRVFLLALSVFAGVVLALFVDRWFVIPFMVLKTIVDLGTQLQFIAARSASQRPAQS